MRDHATISTLGDDLIRQRRMSARATVAELAARVEEIEATEREQWQDPTVLLGQARELLCAVAAGPKLDQARRHVAQAWELLQR